MSSINYQNPLNAEGQSFMEALFGKAAADDGKSFLYEGAVEINQRDMTELAVKAQQPVTVELYADGEIKTMADGTCYQVTNRGWRKVSNG